jgi:hypothetical protein
MLIIKSTDKEHLTLGTLTLVDHDRSVAVDGAARQRRHHLEDILPSL